MHETESQERVVLLVEDCSEDRESMARALRRTGLKIRLESVQRR